MCVDGISVSSALYSGGETVRNNIATGHQAGIACVGEQACGMETMFDAVAYIAAVCGLSRISSKITGGLLKWHEEGKHRGCASRKEKRKKNGQNGQKKGWRQHAALFNALIAYLRCRHRISFAARALLAHAVRSGAHRTCTLPARISAHASSLILRLMDRRLYGFRLLYLIVLCWDVVSPSCAASLFISHCITTRQHLRITTPRAPCET